MEFGRMGVDPLHSNEYPAQTQNIHHPEGAYGALAATMARNNMEPPPGQWVSSLQARELVGGSGGFPLAAPTAFNDAGGPSRADQLRRSGNQMVVMEDPDPSQQRLQEHRRLAQALPRWVLRSSHEVVRVDCGKSGWAG